MATGGPAVVRYFEGDQYVGERQVYFAAASVGGESFSGHWPHVAHVCPECGELWLREVNDYGFTYSPRPSGKWLSVLSLCPLHGPGLILDDRSNLEFCSPDLLRREATLILLKGLI